MKQSDKLDYAIKMLQEMKRDIEDKIELQMELDPKITLLWINEILEEVLK